MRVQRRRQTHREDLEDLVDTLVIQKSKQLTREQNKVFWLTIAATVTLVALGLVMLGVAIWEFSTTE